MPPLLPLGYLLKDEFEIIELLATGGMGEVYRARQDALDRDVAIKVLLPGEDAQLFVKEAKRQATIRHPHVLDVFTAGQDSTSGVLYIVMPLMARTLESEAPPMHPLDVVRWLTPVAQALDYIHGRNLLHRDLKPRNLLISADGTIYIADFGIAKDLSAGSTASKITGTDDYMAPEQRRAERLSPATDVYALAVIAYRLLTAQLPFVNSLDSLSKNPRSVTRFLPSLGSAIDTVFATALERAPSKRFQTASAFITALREASTPTAAPLPIARPAVSTAPATSVAPIAPAAVATAVAAYLHAVEAALQRGNATEHTFRPAIKALFEACIPDLVAVNEPRRIACGAPDLQLDLLGLVIGHVEAKVVDADLAGMLADSERATPRSREGKQLDRYRGALPSLLLTDCLEWRWLVNGEQHPATPIRLASWDGRQLQRSATAAADWAALLTNALANQFPGVRSPRELADRLARLARLIHDAALVALADAAPNDDLMVQRNTLKELLLPELTDATFADLYAQTIAYGLFTARVVSPTKTFTLQQAAYDLPPAIPFLKRLFSEIAGPTLDDRVKWIVDDLVRLLGATDVAAVMANFGRATMQIDPVVHFYEDFLKAYDPRLRETRGVYYTPQPVVEYIVRSVDHLLKSQFQKYEGLADESVLLLDPATGTATFPHAVVRHIHQFVTTNIGSWNEYVGEKLLPRLFAFELLIAPYTIAHLKLTLLLKEQGYTLAKNERFGVYLTNTIADTPNLSKMLPGMGVALTQEARAAEAIKHEKAVMVVLGNPPYSVSSANRGVWINDLMDSYKKAVRSERNLQPLSDDYIKFLRFAQWRIEETGSGIVGFITNNSYLSGLIHRGMRRELRKAFDEIYILNLHGNSLIGERSPDGSPDMNVFDIQQGVAIVLAIRAKDKQKREPAVVRYAELWGQRSGKYEFLTAHDVQNTPWQTLAPDDERCYFVPGGSEIIEDEFGAYTSLTDVFRITSVSLVTHRDKFVTDFRAEDLRERIDSFANSLLSDETIADRYELHDNRDWSMSAARISVRNDAQRNSRFTTILYRPFDIRHIFYSKDTLDFPRVETMRHLQQSNIALVAPRQVTRLPYNNVTVSANLVEFKCVSHDRNCNVFPLYLYPTEAQAQMGMTRTANLAPAFVRALAAATGLAWQEDGRGDGATTFGPEDVFHYMYAVLYAPGYRLRYAELLKRDFARVPLPTGAALFWGLAAQGAALVDLHLLRLPGASGIGGAGGAAALATPGVLIGGSGDSQVAYVRYEPPTPANEHRGRVHINPVRYFAGIAPAEWQAQIGGYQPAKKWLDDRKGRTLSFDEIRHYQRMIAALRETAQVMSKIDALVPTWPLGG